METLAQGQLKLVMCKNLLAAMCLGSMGAVGLKTPWRTVKALHFVAY